MTIDTLWFTRCPAPSAASIAIRNRWLEEEFAPDGIAVASLAASTDKAVHLSHYRHTQPNSFRFGGYVPPLVTRAQGTDVRVVGLAWPDRVAEVVVAADSPIRTGADLRGHRLGVPKRLNDSIDWWRATVLAGYDEALVAAGLPADSVTLVDIPVARAFVEDITLGAAHAQSLWGARSQFAVQREEAAALIRGEVDALYTDAAMGAILKAAYGFRPVVNIDGSEDGEYGSNGFPIVLTLSGGLIDARPDLVVRWIRRLLDADAWAQAHEPEAKRILARDTGVPEDFLDLAYSPRVHRQLDVSLSENRVALLQAKHDALLRHGFLAAQSIFPRSSTPRRCVRPWL
jgi:ABC-type nitrate/sulfonate/bicarbonate transport system substrate-binding protein